MADGLALYHCISPGRAESHREKSGILSQEVDPESATRDRKLEETAPPQRRGNLRE